MKSRRGTVCADRLDGYAETADDRIEAALAGRARSGRLMVGVEAAPATNPPAAGQSRDASQVRPA